MERLDHTRTVAAALVHLGDAGPEGAGKDRTGLSGKVDKLVDGYLVSFNISALQTTAMRKILADEFLATAPFTELSYRIWRRIMREDTETPEPVLRVASDHCCRTWIFQRGRFSSRNAPPLPPETIGARRKNAALVLRPAAIEPSPSRGRLNFSRACAHQPGCGQSGSRAALPSYRP